jgi:hypothetical protein
MAYRTISTISSLRGANYKKEGEFENICHLLDAQVTFPEVEICTTDCGACVGNVCAMDGQSAPVGKPCRASNKESL